MYNPPSIIKQIPSFINGRLSTLSPYEEVCLNNIPPYREVVKKSGFRDELTYVSPKKKNINMKRENGNEKLFGSIHHIQKMSRLKLVRYSLNYYINIFHHHIHFIKSLIKSQLRYVTVVFVA